MTNEGTWIYTEMNLIENLIDDQKNKKKTSWGRRDPCLSDWCAYGTGTPATRKPAGRGVTLYP